MMQLKPHMFSSDPVPQSGVQVADQSAVAVLQMPCVHQPKVHCTQELLKCHATPPSYPSTAPPPRGTVFIKGKFYSYTQLQLRETCSSCHASETAQHTLEGQDTYSSHLSVRLWAAAQLLTASPDTFCFYIGSVTCLIQSPLFPQPLGFYSQMLAQATNPISPQWYHFPALSGAGLLLLVDPHSILRLVVFGLF